MLIKYAFKFDENRKPVINWFGVYNSIKEVLKIDPDDKMFTMVISRLLEPKTYSQLAYLHAEILLKVIYGYREAGYDVPLNKIQAMEWVKKQVKTLPEIMFVENITNILTGEVTINLRSFASGSKVEISDIIDKCIRIYGDFFGIIFESPIEYKQRMRLK